MIKYFDKEKLPVERMSFLLTNPSDGLSAGRPRHEDLKWSDPVLSGRGAADVPTWPSLPSVQCPAGEVL